jgi:hypothetical protein
MTDLQTMSLDDEMPWRSAFPPEIQSFYDDTGFSFTAETDDYDVMVGNFFYHFQGGPERPLSQWLADGWVHNDLVVIAPKSQRGKPLLDNNFHRTTMNPTDFHKYDDLKLTRTDDRVTWQLGETVFTCTPPNWHIGGRSGEAIFDVSLHQLPDPVVWSYGTREVAGGQGIGGGYCYIGGEGTITLGDQVLLLRNIAGVHERLAFSTGLNVLEGVKRDTGFGSGIAIHVLEGDVHIWGLGDINALMFFVTVEGQHLTFLPGEPTAKVTYTPLDQWHDKRSGMLMPSRWSLVCESDEGRLDLELAANARGYYPWDMKHGYQMMYWFLCMANGTFTFPDGRQIPIVNQRAQHEIVKVVVAHQETMSGPIVPEIA